jgi:hypothetical protein
MKNCNYAIGYGTKAQGIRVCRKTYDTRKGNTQHELQCLAKDIFAFGKIEEVTHHGCTTIHPNGDRIDRETGSMCFKVKSEDVPVTYWVHVSGFRIAEIIEEAAL